MELSIMEQLCFCTVRIETRDIDNNCYSGTGFFFNLSVDEKVVPVIITNKHVVKGMTSGQFVDTVPNSVSELLFAKHVPDRRHRMINQHPWSGPAHDGADALAHVLTVAVDWAFAAGGFL